MTGRFGLEVGAFSAFGLLSLPGLLKFCCECEGADFCSECSEIGLKVSAGEECPGILIDTVADDPIADVVEGILAVGIEFFEQPLDTPEVFGASLLRCARQAGKQVGALFDAKLNHL